MARSSTLTVRYSQSLRLAPTRGKQGWLVVLAVLYFVVPSVLGRSFWLNVLDYAGIAAIGAVGLNLLTGYTGQVSLGHAAFIGVGAYTAGFLGATHGLSLLVWLPASALVGAVVGAVLGLVALRLRGNYLAIVTVGFIFLAQYVFQNWTSVTNGVFGLNTVPSGAASIARVGGYDFGDLRVLGQVFNQNQGFFFLIWGLLAVLVLLAKNVVRTRPGRAMQAVRDRDVAAEVIGVGLFRTKVGAFALASAYAAIAGALVGAFTGYIGYNQFDLLMSIQYVAIIIVGGVGTIYGGVIGAIAVGALPQIISQYSGSIPGLAGTAATSGVTPAILAQILYGLLIVVFLVVEPGGIAALWRRVKAYFATWPFRY